MSEAAKLDERMTVDEFIHFEGEGDTRYQLFDGIVVAVALARAAHGTICANLGGELQNKLRDRAPCRPVSGAGIRIDELNCYVADIAVTCAPPDDSVWVEEPLLIVEVLSESTADDDLGRKLQDYIILPTLREIWLIDSRERWVEIWWRHEDKWVVQLPLRGRESLQSVVLDAAVDLDEIYLNTTLSASSAAP